LSNTNLLSVPFIRTSLGAISSSVTTPKNDAQAEGANGIGRRPAISS